TVFILVLFLSCFFLASVVPPLQSPDEFDHMKRAYLLTKGQLVLNTPVDAPSGGMIDTDLITYLEAYQPFSIDRQVRVSSDLQQAAGQIPWTDREEFSLTPGTGYYFPAIYAPQALGLFLGKSLGLTVHHSYTLSRFITLALVTGVLLWAVRVQPPSYAALALLAMPISLLQIASPTIDGISTALSILAVSLFLKIARERSAATRDFVVLCLAVLIVASSRAHLLSMVLLL